MLSTNKDEGEQGRRKKPVLAAEQDTGREEMAHGVRLDS